MVILKALLVGCLLFCFNAAVVHPSTGSDYLPPLGVLVEDSSIAPIVLVHGGAGDIPCDSVLARKRGVKTAARVGYAAMGRTGSVLDAVQEAVENMESNGIFNAGYGGVLTWDGKVEMDAAIMNGVDLDAGCVSLVHDIEHPIRLARRIMQKTRHMYLAGEGAMAFAEEENFELLPEGALVTPNALQSLQNFKRCWNFTSPFKKSPPHHLPELPDSDSAKEDPACAVSSQCDACTNGTFGSPGTVGAVAIDRFGNVAAATSTGGITGKMPGRIGDSPVLGGGTYADNLSGAISATGNGETIMRYNVASRILGFIQNGVSAQAATEQVLFDMQQRFNQTAGVIGIDANGNVGVAFTSCRMPWAYQRGNTVYFGVDKGEVEWEVIGEPRVPH